MCFRRRASGREVRSAAIASVPRLGSLLLVWLAATTTTPFPFLLGLAYADVATGSPEKAKSYYISLAKALDFSSPEEIVATTLEDVTAYLGYSGVTGKDLQDVLPERLSSFTSVIEACPPERAPCSGLLEHPNAVLAAAGSVPFRPDDILATRFFAPKIMNVNEPEATRKVGWRKLVRLRARDGSAASAHHISAGIVLFNFFTDPGIAPFGPEAESVNTQVMLITDPSTVPLPGKEGPATLYWLDYDRLSKGGKLSLALEASFDATELQREKNGVQPYFVPDGCNACHGINQRRALVNYLDTDHWFDRLDNDFPDLKARGFPLLVDAGTNDISAASYKVAFDVIRRFNEEADQQARRAQPKHDEVLAAEQWLTLHAKSNDHITPADRAIGAHPRWSPNSRTDAEALTTLNQYCFRCHGTIKFSVFNKAVVLRNATLIRASIDPTSALRTNPAFRKMPPDRDLLSDARNRILKVLPGGAQ